MPPVTSAKISVVVQGPCAATDITLAGRLAQIRAVLPRCELILSTYDDAQVPEGCAVDRLVRSADPGAVPTNPDLPGSRPHNLNRQLTTTRAGLRAATRPYAVKLRTDCGLRSDAFVHAFAADHKPSACSFLHRVQLLDVFTRSPVAQPALFHGSDIFHFGFTEDVRSLWDAPLVPEPEFTHWFRSRLYPPPQLSPALGLNVRLLPEQYICLEYFKRAVDSTLDLRAPLDVSWRLLHRAERLMVSHFQLLDWRQSGIELPARFGLNGPPARCYRPATWRLLERALAAGPGAFAVVAAPRFLSSLARYHYTRSRQLLLKH